MILLPERVVPKVDRLNVGAVAFLALLLFTMAGASGATMPPSIEASAPEPLKYVGERQTDRRFFDGGLPHAVGVHSHQVFRANRRFPSEGGAMGWTYNHQPFLVHWKGTFYVSYLSNPQEEHQPPGRTLIVRSENGRDWSNPDIVFPTYSLPEIEHQGITIPKGTGSVMHQRMGFYVAPNERLLALGFYSFTAHTRTSPNAGQGLGRVVREIREDGTFGPIYFVRYNRHAGWDEMNTDYPPYLESDDPGFVEACEALLGDKLITLQWWEEDRADDGFYVIDPGDVENAYDFSFGITTFLGAGKALCFYHRPDGAVVAVWKNRWSAISPDEGETWTGITRLTTLRTVGAKVWVQSTPDDRYALVYDHSATQINRFPLTVMSSDDGYAFDDLLTVQGEVPPQRYQGTHRSLGPQYVRGIVEGNGRPSDDFIHVVYSMSKEDIWFSRIHAPVTGSVTDHVDQSFEEVESVTELKLWNLYCPQWAPVRVVEDAGDRFLEFRDEEPYDHARVERVIPAARKLEVSFRIQLLQVPVGRAFELEIQDQKGTRPMRLRFDAERIYQDRGSVPGLLPVPYDPRQWHQISLRLDCDENNYDLYLDGELVRANTPFAVEIQSFERIVMRTGPYRNDVRGFLVDGEPGPSGLYSEDLPGGEQKDAAVIVRIDDVQTRSL